MQTKNISQASHQDSIGDSKTTSPDSAKYAVDDANIIARSAPAEVSEVDLYKKREKIYTRKIEGFFQRVRLYTGWPLLLAYFITPWISWGDRPAVLFDLPTRQFHILWLTIWPQDLSILGLILIICAFALFAITALAGRVWCGYTCPQTIWTAIFMWIEQMTEGTRNQRIRLDSQPWSLQKAWKKVCKHLAWLGFATLTGVTFVGYFTPIKGIVSDILALDLAILSISWIIFFTLATYLNAGWVREQLCKYVCPYARFQSAMFDKNTLIISYDKQRGEPRGSRKRELAEMETDKGACVDCKLCVQVCPTGIDIRNGLQYECISCALCIDACNKVMDKMGYDRGLIRYTTEFALTNREKINFESIFLRWKVLGYVIALLLCLVALGFRLINIEPIELTIMPDRQALSSEFSQGIASNRYLVKIVNKKDMHLVAKLTLDTDINFILRGPKTINIEPSQLLSFPVRIELSRDSSEAEYSMPVIPIIFNLDVNGDRYSVTSRFIAGRR